MPQDLEFDNLDGFVDEANASKISGWMKWEYAGRPVKVLIDGVPVDVSPSYYSRPDLIEADVDGVGFTIYYYSFSTAFNLEVVVGADREEATRKLVFADSGKPALAISDVSLDMAILSPDELTDLVGSLNADTPAFLTAMQKFGKILAKNGSQFDVHFIDGSYGTVSTRYRILNIADGMLEAGYKCIYSTLSEESLNDIVTTRARIVVFFRAPLNDLFQRALDSLRNQGCRIIFDVDDLVFDETILHGVDGIRFLDQPATDLYMEGVRLYRRFAEAADLITTSTTYLADYARKNLERDAVVIRNSIGKNYLKAFEKTEQAPLRPEDGKYVIGYYSGSKTHQNDFKSVYPALVSFMEKQSNAIFRIVGLFDLDEFPRLRPYSDRIVVVPLMQYWEMIDDLDKCDVIIAPLMINDPFCEAKSELKFFEAALRKRPCIASATQTFVEADDGHGIIHFASTAEDWLAAFEFFAEAANRAENAERAYAYAIDRYSYRQAAGDAQRAYFGFTRRKRSSNAAKPVVPVEPGARQSIGVIVPEIFIGGGGHRKIFRFCKDIAAAGHELTIYVDSKRSPVIVHQEIRRHFYDFEAEVKSFRIVDPSHDVLICTHWSTAYGIRNQRFHGRKLYFVQDYEPMFEPVNTNYVKALTTYTMGFDVLCFGNWVANRLESEFHKTVTRIPFTLDHDTYYPEARQKTVDVLLFARPSQPRRCFELAAEALKILYKQNRSIRIGLYGEEAYGDLGFQYHNFGLIKDQKVLADLYRSARVGICFSTTNPSLVGYEMIACGLPLVDVRVPGYEVNFGGEDIVFYADGFPESVADAISAALNNESDCMLRVERGLRLARQMPSDDAIGSAVLGTIAG